MFFVPFQRLKFENYVAGTSVEAEVRGKRELKLLDKGESYVVNSPKLLIKFLPVPGVDWVGNVKIQCKESGLEAELCYRGSSFTGRGRSIRGRILKSSSGKTICEIDGHWDRYGWPLLIENN